VNAITRHIISIFSSDIKYEWLIMLQILCDNRLNILNCCILYALRTSIYVIEIFVLQTSPPFKSSNVLHCKVWLSGVLVLLWPSALHDAITHQFYTHCFNSVSRSDWVGQLFPSFSVSTNFVAENIIFVLSVFVFKPVTSILDFHFTVFTHRLSFLSAIKIKLSAYSSSPGKPPIILE